MITLSGKNCTNTCSLFSGYPVTHTYLYWGIPFIREIIVYTSVADANSVSDSVIAHCTLLHDMWSTGLASSESELCVKTA